MKRRYRIIIVIALGGFAGFLALLISPRPLLYTPYTFSTALQDRDGKLMRLSLATDQRYRLFTPLEAIDPHAIRVTLMYEDRHFYHHPGVNLYALARSAWSTYVRRNRAMGGSTITMQLARMRFALDTRTISGKITQILRAVQLERHYSKEDILEAYLNLAPYGGNIEGLGTAALIYFAKPAAQLSLAEAAALAVIPQNPVRRNPVSATGYARMLAARARLLEIWNTQFPLASEPLALLELPLKIRPANALPFAAPHVTQMLLTRADLATGLHQTTVSLRYQDLLEDTIRRYLERRSAVGIHNASAMLIDHRSMEVIASVGSADFNDAAIFGQVNGTRAKRSPGSTLKPFVYAMAMDQGLIHPMSMLKDAPKRFGVYTPENFDRGFMGPVTARDALIYSRNVPAIELLSRVGYRQFHEFLGTAAVADLASPEHYGLAMILGGNELTMEELVRLYAMLPNGGTFRPLRYLQSTAAAADGPSLMSAEASFLVLDMLRDNPRPDRLELQSTTKGIPIAWKTGTSYAYRDAWTAGVFGPYVLVVWLGNFDGSGNPALIGRQAAAPLFFTLTDRIAGQFLTDPFSSNQFSTGQFSTGQFSTGQPATDEFANDPVSVNPVSVNPTSVKPVSVNQLSVTPVSADTMSVKGFARAPAAALNVRKIDVCAGTGDLPGRHCPATETGWFIPGVSPIKVSDVHRAVRIDARTGKRSCRFDPETTFEQVYEFWPSDLERLFQQAGISKRRPPPWNANCALDDQAAAGIAPQITSPAPLLRYHVRPNRQANESLPLTATVDGDVDHLFWFVNASFVGQTRRNEPLLWQPFPGEFDVLVVDDLGRSASSHLTVTAVH